MIANIGKARVTLTAATSGLGKDSGHARSTTQAAISGIAGNKDVRTGDKETGIQKIFDQEKVQKDINAQVKITQEFGQQASRAIGNYAAEKLQEANNLRTQGREDEARTAVVRACSGTVVSAPRQRAFRHITLPNTKVSAPPIATGRFPLIRRDGAKKLKFPLTLPSKHL